VGQLCDDLAAMSGVWLDRLSAFDLSGHAVDHDPFGGVAGPFPYQNLVYVEFERIDDHSGTFVQTNVAVSGRPLHQRTFEADVVDDQLRFRRLGPDAPHHVGVSGGPGLIWFVAQHMAEPGLQRYCEPDLIRLDVTPEASGGAALRWRTTILWRDGQLVRPLLVEGVRVSHDATRLHETDPRRAETAGADAAVHGDRSITRQYLESR